MNFPNQDPQASVIADLLLQPKNRANLATQAQPRNRYVETGDTPAYPTQPIGSPFAR